MLLHRLPETVLDHPAAGAVRLGHAFLAVRRLPRRWLLPEAAAGLLIAALFPAALLAPEIGGLPNGPTQICAAAAGSAALWLFLTCTDGPARPLQGPPPLPRAPASFLIWLGSVLLLVFAADAHLPASRYAAGVAALLLLHAALRRLARHRLQTALRAGACVERALMLAETAVLAREAAAAVEAATCGSIRIVSSTAMPDTPGAPSIAWVEDAIAGDIADRILIAGFDQLAHATQAVLPRLRALDVDITLLGDPAALPPIPSVATRIGSLPAVRIAAPPRASRQAALKRCTDLLIAMPLLALAAPLLLFIAALIRIDSPGSVLFAQERIGFRGQVFRMLKFRTMYAEMTDDVAHRQTSRNDSRVTRVGRVLRRCSLDEIPQLINVLRGEMSVVGPRPHAIGMTVLGRSMNDVIGLYPVRHCVKPGITGWAQINGCRGEVSCEGKLRRRLALDCEYIESWSPAMDIWIMARTAATLLFDRHAY